MPLSRGARRTLQALQYFFNGKAECWPRQETIARRVGCGLRSVKRYLDELREAGVIRSHQRPNSACVYHLVDCKELALPDEFGTPDGTPVGTPTMKEVEVTSLNVRTARLEADLVAYFADTTIGGKMADRRLIRDIAALLTTDEAVTVWKYQIKRFGKMPTSWGFFLHLAREVAGPAKRPQGKQGLRAVTAEEVYGGRPMSR